MSDQRKRIDEQALDAFLVEALGNVQAPDLSTRILTRLSDREGDSEAGQIVTSPRSKPLSRAGIPRRAVAWSLALTVAVAASILTVVWLRMDQGMNDSVDVAVNQGLSSDTGEKIARQTGTVTESNDAQTPSVRPRGIPLVMESSSDAPSDERSVTELNEPPVQGPVPAVTLVSKQFDSELVGYWNAIGIEPAAEARATEVVERLDSILGVRLPTQTVTDPEQLQVEFQRDEVAREVALRWLQQMTEGGMRRLDPESRDQLTNDLTACIQGKAAFDRTVVSWIDGRSPTSSSFYGAMWYGGRDAMVRRLAALTMNVDVRCIRCHDATIEGAGQQQDYWEFAALLSRGVLRDAEGIITIRPDAPSSSPFFYELADGRQRLAEPSVSQRWMGSPALPPAPTVRAWSAQLMGSEALARGAVNSLWLLVHGQPLRGRVVDPITAPHNEALDRVEDHLVQDLIRSSFDVSRTLSLIIASPATRRAVPETLLPENALVVTESDKRKAFEAVNAFAAALPRHSDLSMKQRLDQATRAIGGKLDPNGQPFVAQIGDSGDERSGSNVGTSNSPIAVDFPVRGESLPVQWLTLIDDDQSQIEHLGYLAGMPKLPDNVWAAVKAMQGDDRVSKELMLNRVWWLVRP